MTDQSSPASEALLPCPFCGEHQAKIMPRSCTGIAAYFQAECAECGATSHGSYHLDKEGAASEWNTRDLDNEQPLSLHVSLTLGDIRKLRMMVRLQGKNPADFRVRP